MARKHIFDNLMRDEPPATAGGDEPTAEYRKFGAAKSISSSIDELAKQASKLAEGETVIEIDPDLVESSFVSDRMDAEEDKQYLELLEAIRERGQSTPILIRPHPIEVGRYMVVFGHRRVRVAKQLGRPVRAVVRTSGRHRSCCRAGPRKLCSCQPYVYRTCFVCAAARRSRVQSGNHSVGALGRLPDAF